MQQRVLSSIDEVSAADWNALSGAQAPFLRHEFLAALEHQACVGATSGWTPSHLTLHDARGRLLAAMPLYRKLHSWGEFVFDFAWAQAYTRAGLAYYPKLVGGVPFTPATGPRLLVAAAEDADQIRRQLLEHVLEFARDERVSSLHVHFPEEARARELQRQGLMLRRDCQFHWHNRDYHSFEHFLEHFTADKRKKARRERRRLHESGISFTTLAGGDIDQRLWKRIYGFHADTFLRHGHTPYLSLGFFLEVAERLPDSIVVQLASSGSQPVAAAICFKGTDTLYGRYWGTSVDLHSLHFEICYYQGIDYCIRNGLQRFEPGTQGEHKVSRGFEPAYTWSAHWIADPQFRHAIGEYLQREAAAVTQYATDVLEHVPYKEASPPPPAAASA
ncbi:MAG TPA: GNAT family N-acetyltransferase [Steroidobacteraceae bacterium]